MVFYHEHFSFLVHWDLKRVYTKFHTIWAPIKTASVHLLSRVLCYSAVALNENFAMFKMLFFRYKEQLYYTVGIKQ